MNAAIITIGDEILIGQITDTNSAWIAREFTKQGVNIAEMASISDTSAAIISTLNRFIGRVDIILLTGGLGPTKDDLTKQTLAEYFESQLVLNEEVLAIIEDYFRKTGRTIIESNRQQAMVPDKCKLIVNHNGTAPGMWFEEKNTQIISMPGVPYEMKPMVTDSVIPALKEHLNIPAIVHKTIMTQGVPESYLAETISKWEQNLPDCLKLAYLPRPGIVRLRLTATGSCAEKATFIMEKQVKLLNEIIREHIFAYDDISLEEVIGHILKEKSMTLSTAESCTGGNIARLITSIPGSSAYFKGAVVSYSNETKEHLLNVSGDKINEKGAVSKEVVEMMANGVLKKLDTDVSIAVSGIAGPEGGTNEKPVGTVWIAIANHSKTFSKKFSFAGNRTLVIEQSSIMALGLLRKFLLKII